MIIAKSMQNGQERIIIGFTQEEIKDVYAENAASVKLGRFGISFDVHVIIGDSDDHLYQLLAPGITENTLYQDLRGKD